MRIALASLLTLCGSLALASGCATAASKDSERQPDYRYEPVIAPSAETSLTVTSLPPVFVGDGERYWNALRHDDVVSGLVGAVHASVRGVLSRLGLAVVPPQSSPVLTLHTALDIQVRYGITDRRMRRALNVPRGDHAVTTCTVTLTPAGQVTFSFTSPTALGPVWSAQVDVTGSPSAFAAQGEVCTARAVTPALRDAWIAAHEHLFRAALDGLTTALTLDVLLAVGRRTRTASPPRSP